MVYFYFTQNKIKNPSQNDLDFMYRLSKITIEVILKHSVELHLIDS